jgi:hypothetical protein
MTSADIQRTEPTALAKIVGTGDVAATMASIERVAQDVVDLARERGFVHRFGESGEWFALPTWQLIGATFGVMAFVERSSALEGGWEARAIARTLDGRDVAAAEGMCLRAEPGRRNASEHALRAMAQVRAQRNALRSALGWALVMAGWDIAAPEAPATRKQVVALHTLASHARWSASERHARAGVESLNDLTREQAAELLDAWTELEPDVPPEQDAGDQHQPAAVSNQAPADREELLEQAVGLYGGKVALLRAALDVSPSEVGVSIASLTIADLEELISQAGGG